MAPKSKAGKNQEVAHAVAQLQEWNQNSWVNETSNIPHVSRLLISKET